MSTAVKTIRRLFVPGLLGLLVLGLAAARVARRARSAAPAADSRHTTGASGTLSATRFKIPVTGSQPSKGRPDALVTVVEWSDIQCAECERGDMLVDRLLHLYPKDLRIVWRNAARASGPDSIVAADLAMEAYTQAGKFWEARSLIRTRRAPLTEADIETFAKQLGLDVSAAKQAHERQDHYPHIVNDGVMGGAFGVREIPAFFINGIPFTGPMTLGALKAAVEPELARARGLVAAGVAAKDVYAQLTKDAMFHVPEWKNPAEQP